MKGNGVNKTERKLSSRRKKIFTRNNIILYLMILPVFLQYLIFTYIPMAGIAIAFTDFTAGGFQGWVGLKHFKYLFNLPFFWTSLRNTISFISINYLIAFPAPIILALMLNEVRRGWFKKFVQTVTIMPHFISWIVVSGIFLALLSPNSGYVNEIIKLFGGTPVYFMGESEWFQLIVSFVRVWKGVGYSTIIYLAALSSVDQELYEATVVDGANRWKQTWYITLPAIKPVILVVFVLSFAGVLNLFEPVFVFLNDMVRSTGEVLDTYVYKVGIQNGKYPIATAMGLFKSVIAFVLVVITNLLSKKLTEDGRSVI